MSQENREFKNRVQIREEMSRKKRIVRVRIRIKRREEPRRGKS